MDSSTLENYVKGYIEAQDSMFVDFALQGGEPTLMGLPFFRHLLALQDKYKGEKTITNTIQTNGILIDDKWCDLFAKYDFLVGISIDGPPDLHDKYRVTRSGKPTHEKVIRAIELLKKHNIAFNTLTVVSNVNAKEPIRTYEYLKQIGSTYMQFIPLIERAASEKTEHGLLLLSPSHCETASVTPWSVEPREYGAFLNEIYDVWIQKDIGNVFVPMFEHTLSVYAGLGNPSCVFSETCGHLLALEANGDLYNCDHYVYPEHKLGNINQSTVREMNNSVKAIEFGLNKSKDMPSNCNNCRYKPLCHGGCPKHRFSSFEGLDVPNGNYLCEGYKMFFSHTKPSMEIIARRLRCISSN